MIHPPVRRLAAISQGMIQMFSKFLTFLKMMLGIGQKRHFEHILNNCPENGPSSTKIYEVFEAKIINFEFFQNFDKQKFQFWLKSESLMFWEFC